MLLFGPAAVVASAAHTGTIESLGMVESRHVAPRTVQVWLPPGYAESPQRRYPVLVLHDGRNVFQPGAAGAEWGVDETAQRLVAAGAIEPLIVVAVDHGPDRIGDYTPTAGLLPAAPGAAPVRAGGGAPAYARFLIEELKPLIDRRYRTRPEAASTAVGGSSLGGLVSLWLALEHGQTFGQALVVSPSLWWDEGLAQRLVDGWKRGGVRPRLWLDMGAHESPDAVPMLRRLCAALREHGWRDGATLACTEDPDGRHHERSWAARVEPMLRFLHAPASRFAAEVDRRLQVPPAARAAYEHLLDAELARAGVTAQAPLPPQHLLLVDRAEAVQAAMLLRRTAAGTWEWLGASPVSTGRVGRYDHFRTPTGVFAHTLDHPDFRAEGTFNANGIRGYGVRGMRVYDFGWVRAERGWGAGGTSPMRLQVHATDPDRLEPRLGEVASKGCIRIPASLNAFIDRRGLLDADYEAALARGEPLWVLRADRQPLPDPGRWLVIVDSGTRSRPAWSPLPGARLSAPSAPAASASAAPSGSPRPAPTRAPASARSSPSPAGHC